MGLSIGNMPLFIGAATPMKRPEPPKLVDSKFATFAARLGSRDDFVPRFFNSDRPRALSVGFGKGSVSPQTAAVAVISRDLKQTRKVIPTPGEASDRVRARLVERRKAQTREFRKQQLERRNPANSLQARRFIEALNTTAQTTQARLNGEEPPEPNGRNTVQINGETVRFTRRDSAPRFDVRA